MTDKKESLVSERTQEVFIRETRTPRLRHVFIRLVNGDELLEDFGSISTWDVDASLDTDEKGNIIGINISWFQFDDDYEEE